ncbi:MAG: hypothetical protein LBT44_00345 [Clostridiales bacterium]|jgi:uncharacterized membrane protein YcgQ (UPF0703/DUF1980 family)|nr:hypothetical protein [Clostridiales bacterium]
MRKKIAALLMVCALSALAGCQSSGAPELITAAPIIAADPIVADPIAAAADIVKIKEKMFIAQTNDIYYNAEDYLGKTIQYEGIFSVYEDFEIGATYYSVIRYGPGCCGIDANAGFEVVWDQDYPDPDDWVEAVGVLEEFEADGGQYLRLALSSLTILPVRGEEYVDQ